MHWASSGGHVNILSFCLEQGTNPDVLDEARWTPLIIASSAGHENCVHLLLGMTFVLNYSIILFYLFMFIYGTVL